MIKFAGQILDSVVLGQAFSQTECDVKEEQHKSGRNGVTCTSK